MRKLENLDPASVADRWVFWFCCVVILILWLGGW